MQENIIEPNSPIPPASEIPDIIPESVRRIITGQNMTEANYLTRTAAGQVVTPSGEAVVPGIDPTPTNLKSSILMVNPKDTALSLIG